MKPLQRTFREDIGRVSVVEVEVHRLGATQESANLLQSADLFRVKRRDHASMISAPRVAGSPPAGNLLPPSGACGVGQEYLLQESVSRPMVSYHLRGEGEGTSPCQV